MPSRESAGSAPASEWPPVRARASSRWSCSMPRSARSRSPRRPDGAASRPTRSTMSLDEARSDDPRRASLPGSVFEALTSEPARILVVDDEETVAELCQEFLVGEGYDLRIARNGEEATRLLPQMRPDVVLTDINMPGMTGLEVMRFAKEADPEVCVIVLTGHA